MSRPVRIEDVAKAAGVSTATVSRALSQPQRVKQATLELVRTTVEKLGYVPDAAGRALASGRTRTVGCVIPTLDHAIFASSTHAMQTTLAKAGYQLLVASHEYDLGVELELVNALQQRGVDALVLVGAEHHPQLWKIVKEWRNPTLLTWACDARLPSIGFDNHAIAVMATKHLLGLGHRRIGMISGEPEHNDRARARINGLRDTLSAAGCSLPKDYVSLQPMKMSGGKQGLIELMKAKKPPTAILCGNDLLATGALLEAQRQGFVIPRDLSICGIDNHDLGEQINPGLTTISLPTQELGQIAAMQVLASLAGEPIAQQSLLSFDLLVRGSTSTPTKHVPARLTPLTP
jgi:LacI family transcriptional regulator